MASPHEEFRHARACPEKATSVTLRLRAGTTTQIPVIALEQLEAFNDMVNFTDLAT